MSHIGKPRCKALNPRKYKGETHLVQCYKRRIRDQDYCKFHQDRMRDGKIVLAKGETVDE